MTANQFELQNALLPALLVASLAWWGSGQLVKPYADRERDDRAVIAGLRVQIENGQGMMREIQTLETNAAPERVRFEQLKSETPGPSSPALLPEQIKQQFARAKLGGVVVRMNSVREEPELTGFRRSFWSVSVPIKEGGREAAAVLAAIADFKQQYAFAKVVDFEIRADPATPDRRIAQFNLTALMRE
jgi:hypothetical protein